MKSFSQFKQNGNGWFKQRLVPFFNGVYGVYTKLRRVVGNPIVISDASNEALFNLKVFGKSTQNGTPTPDTPVEIVSVENPTVKVDAQNLSVPYTLHGIPVTSDGNYTDANGQQWICDEVDFERGVYVQRTKLIDLKSAPKWETWGVNYRKDGFTGFFQYDAGLAGGIENVICSIVPYNGMAWGGSHISAYCATYGNLHYVVCLANDMLADVSSNEKALESYRNLLESTNAIMLVPIKPIETPLTADQIAAYKALHTNELNTTISNDKNAWMEVMYTSK